MVLNFIRGFFMALADSVPGVSGGTIAFLLGFYDDFINSLQALISGKKEDKIHALIFLAKLAIGWVTGFILSVLVITALFESHIYAISSLFIGFIIFAIPTIIRDEKDVLKNHYGYLIFTIIGVLIVACITYFSPANGGNFHMLATGSQCISITMALYIFFAGAIAISAMVLPGISGSTILLIFGLYAPILGAIKSILKFDFTPIRMVIIFGLGIIAGILVTIEFVKYLLSHFRAQTLYCIIGLMIGSIYAVIMGPASLEVPKPAMTLETFNFLTFIVGGFLIYLLNQLNIRLKNHTKV